MMLPLPSNAPATTATAAATAIAAVIATAVITATATTTATAATTMVKLTAIHCQRKRHQQQHYQCTNSSTKVKMFTSPEFLYLFNLSTVFELVKEIYQVAGC
jgi:hypothetical protein